MGALAAEKPATASSVATGFLAATVRRFHALTHLRLGTTVQARSQPINRLEVVATKMDATLATLRVTIATPNPRARGIARERGMVLIRQPWCRARSPSILLALAAEKPATASSVATGFQAATVRRFHALTHLRLGTTVQ